MKISINAVAFYDGGRWIAQGLEYDICVSTESLPNLLQTFKKAVLANLCVNMELGRTGLEGIPPAPDNFREMFEEAENYIGQIGDDKIVSAVYVPALRLGQIGA